MIETIYKLLNFFFFFFFSKFKDASNFVYTIYKNEILLFKVAFNCNGQIWWNLDGLKVFLANWTDDSKR